MGGANKVRRSCEPRCAPAATRARGRCSDPWRSCFTRCGGRYAQAADAWIVSAVGAPDFPSQSQPCDEDVRRVFCELATRAVNPQVDAGGRRWIAMVVDFFQICLKEADKDALVAHQM